MAHQYGDTPDLSTALLYLVCLICAFGVIHSVTRRPHNYRMHILLATGLVIANVIRHVLYWGPPKPDWRLFVLLVLGQLVIAEGLLWIGVTEAAGVRTYHRWVLCLGVTNAVIAAALIASICAADYIVLKAALAAGGLGMVALAVGFDHIIGQA